MKTFWTKFFNFLGDFLAWSVAILIIAIVLLVVVTIPAACLQFWINLF